MTRTRKKPFQKEVKAISIAKHLQRIP